MRPLTTILAVATLALGLPACRKLGICKDEPFTIPKTANTSDRLRLDGYYYGDCDTDYLGKPLCNTMVFYRDGIVYFCGAPDSVDMDHYVSSLSGAQDVHYVWGTYKIDGNTISTERWLARYSGCCPLQRVTGTIVNDSTIVWNYRETIQRRSKEKDIDVSIYQFVALTKKPDSTNNIIK